MSNFPSHIVQTGKTIHIGFVFDNDSAFGSHISVWRNVVSPVDDSYCIVTTNHNVNDRQSILMFSSETNLLAFQTWWKSYSARFSDCIIDKNQIPVVADGAFISGFPIKERRINTSSLNDSRFSDWCWIVANTSDTVVLIGGYWVFSDQAEWTMFKLKGNHSIIAKYDEDEDDDNCPF